MSTVKRTLETVQFQAESEFRVFAHEGLTSFELDKLDELIKQVSALREVVHMRRNLEDRAPYPLGHTGRWFRTLPPSGRCTYHYTRQDAVKHAEKQSKRLSTDISQATVLCEEWSPTDAQDHLNEGWGMFLAVTNGDHR